MHHVEMRPFLKAKDLAENHRQKKAKENDVLADTPIKVALEAEVKARDRPVKCNRFFSDSQDKSRNPKQLKRECLKR
jgi:hypothetical protein